MYRFETDLKNQGYAFICGTDEAGRGPLAGPVVAAAVILDPNTIIPGIDDSKKLTEITRKRLARVIKETALAYALAFVSAAEIDVINILEASRKAMTEAIRSLRQKPDYILSDAMKLPGFAVPVLALVKGDQLSASIAAASILAKTARDELMRSFSSKFPGYGFEKHKGYPTKSHLEAIDSLGVTEIHRKSFKPIKLRLIRQLALDFKDDNHE